MKQLSLLLSIIAVAISGVLLFLHIKSSDQVKPVIAAPVSVTGSNNNNFKIAYFELDSLQNHYQYFKDELNALKKKEESNNNELAAIDRKNQQKVNEWKQKGNNMSQAEAEAAGREYQQMQQDFQNKKQELDQKINDQMNDTRKKIRDRLEEYLKDYNKVRNFAYIFSDFPEGIFYKDTVYNITNDLIKGLNESYNKKK